LTRASRRIGKSFVINSKPPQRGGFCFPGNCAKVTYNFSMALRWGDVFVQAEGVGGPETKNDSDK
jgi:hypothetical protein